MRRFSLLLLCLAAVLPSSGFAAEPDAVERVVGLATEARSLQARLVALDEAIEASDLERGAARRALAAADREAARGVSRLTAARATFAESQRDLDEATLEYISLVGGLGSATRGGSDAALDYLVDASAQDAVLVYQTATGLLQSRTERLRRLRAFASRRSVSQQRLELADEDLAGTRTSRAAALRAIELHSGRLERSRRSGRADLRALRRLERRYTAAIGRRASLLEVPLGDGARVDAGADGPLRWPVSGSIVSPFQPRRCLGGICRPHEGVDITVGTGTPVAAAAGGRISTAESVSGYGNLVCVRHSSTIETCTAHLSRIGVRRGETVRQGDRIGESGCTGRCFGPHVHLELRERGRAIDPVPRFPTTG